MLVGVLPVVQLANYRLRHPALGIADQELQRAEPAAPSKVAQGSGVDDLSGDVCHQTTCQAACSGLIGRSGRSASS